MKTLGVVWTWNNLQMERFINLVTTLITTLQNFAFLEATFHGHFTPFLKGSSTLFIIDALFAV